MSSRFSDAFILHQAGGDGQSEQAPPVVLDGTVAVSAAFNTVPTFVARLDAYSIQFSTQSGDTLVGTASLQGSNDRSGQEQTGVGDIKTVTNWVTLSLWDWAAGAQAANKAIATGQNTYLIGDRVAGYRWLRLAFAFTSGTGKPKLTFQQKGVS